MFSNDDTICAIASPPGDAIRGIVRVSGPQTLRIVGLLLGPEAVLPSRAERVVGTVDLGDPLGSVDASVLVWPNSQSYTGMPSAEIHLPGAQPILSAALQKILSLGARLAEPGEFTLRAFLAGRLDLTEAEAVLGVIDADDKRSLDVALRQLSGGLSGPLNGLRTELINLLAHLEAGLDFVEEDIEFISQDELRSQVEQIVKRIDDIRAQMRFREGGSKVPQVVLRGEPNAGKSSLINALAGDSVAIVSRHAGTTRDWVEATINIGGVDVRLLDTAGIDDGQEGIDAASQQFGESAEQDADLLLVCVDVTNASLTPWQQRLIDEPNPQGVLFVGTKVDQGLRMQSVDERRWILTSSIRGDGIEALKQRIGQEIQSAASVETATVGSTAVRCLETLTEGSEALQRAIHVIENRLGEELVASELRCALDAIGRVTGVVYTDDILDRIFSEFCIGK